jgi:hypothetical protein
MTDYTQTANFTAKDQLPSGTGGQKLVMGADWDVEFAAIVAAITSKYDSTDIASQATAEAGTDNTTLLTPLRVAQEFRKLGLNSLAYRTAQWTKVELAADTLITGANLFGALTLTVIRPYEIEFVMRLTSASGGINFNTVGTGSGGIGTQFYQTCGCVDRPQDLSGTNDINACASAGVTSPLAL